MEDILIHIEGGIIQAVYVLDDMQTQEIPDITILDIDDEAEERASESTAHTIPVTMQQMKKLKRALIKEEA